MKFHENTESDLFLENEETDRQTDRHDEANNHFSKWFFESLLTKGVTGNTGSFHTVSDAKTTLYQNNFGNFLRR